MKLWSNRRFGVSIVKHDSGLARLSPHIGIIIFANMYPYCLDRDITIPTNERHDTRLVREAKRSCVCFLSILTARLRLCSKQKTQKKTIIQNLSKKKITNLKLALPPGATQDTTLFVLWSYLLHTKKLLLTQLVSQRLSNKATIRPLKESTTE